MASNPRPVLTRKRWGRRRALFPLVMRPSPSSACASTTLRLRRGCSHPRRDMLRGFRAQWFRAFSSLCMGRSSVRDFLAPRKPPLFHLLLREWPSMSRSVSLCFSCSRGSGLANSPTAFGFWVMCSSELRLLRSLLCGGSE